MSGISLLIVGVTFDLLDGNFPDPTFDISNVAPIFPVFIALLAGMIVVQSFGLVSIYPRRSG